MVRGRGSEAEAGASGGAPADTFASKAKWYQKRLDEPLWRGLGGGPDCKITLRQCLYAKLLHKVQYRLSDKAFEEVCRLFAALYLPEGNIFPPTLYLIKRILDIPSVDEHMWHACPKGCKAWEPLPQRDWENHKDDKCRCGTPRFKTGGPRGTQLTPQLVSFRLLL